MYTKKDRKLKAKASLSQIFLLLENNNFAGALKLLNTMEPEFNDFLYVCAFIQCLFEFKHYAQIVNLIEHRESIDNSTSFFCRQSSQELDIFQEAHAIHSQFKAHRLTRKEIICLGADYEVSGRYDSAIELYQSFCFWEADTGMLIHIGRCYEKLDDYKSALQTYLKTPPSQWKLELRESFSNCYQKLAQPLYNSLLYTSSFKFFRAPPEKRITACAVERAYILCTTAHETSEYLKTQQKYSTAVEAIVGL